jgi:hypothetical protein
MELTDYEMFLLSQWVRGKLPYCDEQVSSIMSRMPDEAMMFTCDLRDFANAPVVIA